MTFDSKKVKEIIKSSIKLSELYGFIDQNHQNELIQPKIDPNNPYAPPYVGVYEKRIISMNLERLIKVYIPNNYMPSGSAIMLFPDSGRGASDILINSNWCYLAEQFGFVLLVLEGHNRQWSKKDIIFDLDYANKAFVSATLRDLYSVNEPTFYVAGFGQGAFPAALFSLLNCNIIAGFVANGNIKIENNLLENIGQTPSYGDKYISNENVPLNAWIIDNGRENALLNYLKTACNVQDEYINNKYAKVFNQNPLHQKSNIDNQPVVQVWHSLVHDLEGISENEINQQIWRFLSRTKRHMGSGNGNYRLRKTASDIGLKRFDQEIDGYMRYWYVYEPSRAKHEPDIKYPLVFALHGYSCTGELFAGDSEWHVVGEDRDFFVVYPTAYPGQLWGMKNVPLPLWNMDGDSNRPDDVHFILHVLEDVKYKFPIDSSKVYVAGHSNGSGMTQRLFFDAPEHFAAFGPVGLTLGENEKDYDAAFSGYVLGKNKGSVNLEIKRPLWMMKGEKDVLSADDLSPNKPNYKMLEMMCKLNNIDIKQGGKTLNNGIYTTITYYDNRKNPLVKFSSQRNFPHAYTPDMARMTWDEFFCKYIRNTDGSITYLG